MALETNDIPEHVAITMGSETDLDRGPSSAADFLRDAGVPYSIGVHSAHRTPDRMQELGERAVEKNIAAIIACAGGAAHLPGMIAGHTTRPVIGLPGTDSTYAGVAAMLSIHPMPPGVPVGTVGIGKGKQAAEFASRILALPPQAIVEILISNDAFRTEVIEMLQALGIPHQSILSFQDEMRTQINGILITDSMNQNVLMSGNPTLVIPRKKGSQETGVDVLAEHMKMIEKFPVVSVSGGKNAALFAARMRSVHSPEVQPALEKHRLGMKDNVLEQHARMQKWGSVHGALHVDYSKEVS